MFAPVIESVVAVEATFRVKFPQFELTVDEGDGTEPDGSRDYVGIFETEASDHDIRFHGATPEHVVGLANLYAQKLTGDQPYNLTVDFAPEVPVAQLP